MKTRDCFGRDGWSMARRMGPRAEKRTVAVTLAAALPLGGSVHAQSSSNPFGFLGNLFTSSPSPDSRTAAAPAQPVLPGRSGGPSQGWSGQDGASGDPLMTAAAIQ